MDARLLVESKYLRSETFGIDLPKEPMLTIAKVELAEGQGDSEKERWGLLYWRETNAKPLKVNRTHQKCLIAMFGNETDNWHGKRLSLYAMRGKWFGQEGTAVRIKGSPDLKENVSVEIKEGRGKSAKSKVYNLAAMGSNQTSKLAKTDAAVHVIFSKSPLYGRELKTLTVEELQGLVLVATEAMKADSMTTDQLTKLETQSHAIKSMLESHRWIDSLPDQPPREPGAEG